MGLRQRVRDLRKGTKSAKRDAVVQDILDINDTLAGYGLASKIVAPKEVAKESKLDLAVAGFNRALEWYCGKTETLNDHKETILKASAALMVCGVGTPIIVGAAEQTVSRGHEKAAEIMLVENYGHESLNTIAHVANQTAGNERMSYDQFANIMDRYPELLSDQNRNDLIVWKVRPETAHELTGLVEGVNYSKSDFFDLVKRTSSPNFKLKNGTYPGVVDIDELKVTVDALGKNWITAGKSEHGSFDPNYVNKLLILADVKADVKYLTSIKDMVKPGDVVAIDYLSEANVPLDEVAKIAKTYKGVIAHNDSLVVQETAVFWTHGITRKTVLAYESYPSTAAYFVREGADPECTIGYMRANYTLESIANFCRE